MDHRRESHHGPSSLSVDASARDRGHVRLCRGGAAWGSGPLHRARPAHPGASRPGDSRVSLRFVSGSQGTVLHVNAAIGWIEVQGEPVRGTENTGWITPRYLASDPGTGE